MRTKISVHYLKAALLYRFSLHNDQADPALIDSSIRDGVVFRGTNLWVLMLAIFIASIGLNVNSTAVIIGAMLISPLMGPIMGVGYGAGINDYELIRRALKNLGIAVLISLITSAFYFLISPLSEAQSELLARTSPTIWDVLIAFFGGLAGIIAATRKEKSNVIPGVAIATALMPPLCTAGYGIATGSPHYFLGAFYLFLINCVFIAFSTLLVVAYIAPPHKRFVSAAVEKRVHRIILAVVLITVIPSVFLAYKLVNEELFRSRANNFVKKEFVFDKAYVAKQSVSPEVREIDISLVGDNVSGAKLQALEAKLKEYKLSGARLIVHQSSNLELDMEALKTDLFKDVISTSQQSIEDKNQRILALEKELLAAKVTDAQQKDVVQELQALFPEISRVALAKMPVWEAHGKSGGELLFVEIVTGGNWDKEEKRRIVKWLKTRMSVQQVHLIVSTGAAQ